MRRRLGPSATLGAAILVVNLVGAIAVGIGGEGYLPTLALVGLGDIAIAVLAALRGFSGLRHLDPIRLGGAVLAMTLITAWFWFWADPIREVGRRLDPINGQELADGFIAAYGVLLVLLSIAAIASIVRGDRRAN